jgi:hypothetical protein
MTHLTQCDACQLDKDRPCPKVCYLKNRQAVRDLARKLRKGNKNGARI